MKIAFYGTNPMIRFGLNQWERSMALIFILSRQHVTRKRFLWPKVMMQSAFL